MNGYNASDRYRFVCQIRFRSLLLVFAEAEVETEQEGDVESGEHHRSHLVLGEQVQREVAVQPGAEAERVRLNCNVHFHHCSRRRYKLMWSNVHTSSLPMTWAFLSPE